MKRCLTVLLMLLSMVSYVDAADPKAGEEKAAACAVCHGKNGVSVSDGIPNLAAQRAKYLTAQLKAFRDETRKSRLMGIVASLLDDADIDHLAAYFGGLPGAAPNAKSEIPETMTKTHVSFPANYKKDFTLYTTINFPKRKQVRHYYANNAAVQAARAGQPMPDGAMFFVGVFKAKLDAEKKPMMGDDGFYVKDALAVYTAMQTQKGWGSDFPDMLRNGDWNYAVFNADKTLKPGVSQASCLVCHLPHKENGYLFTMETLTKKARE